MTNLPVVQADKLQHNDTPKMIFILVRDAYELLWNRNPKHHSIPNIRQSIQEHEFQELPKYDGILDGIKAGNGRVESLYFMEQDGDDLPRGLATNDQGQWAMPLLIGTDAGSVELAMAYALDSNNLTMMGSDFTNLDISKLWDQSIYSEILNEIAEQDIFPASVDNAALESLNAIMPVIVDENSLPSKLDDVSKFDGSGDQFQRGRIILVWKNESEKNFIANLLEMEITKVIYPINDLMIRE